ncbi:MAG: hypothetical protein U0264_02050 [Candidatus Kapaibacterium sp.]
MGTWNNTIEGNDTFQDIYQNFFSLYNQGKSPKDISKQIQDDFGAMFNDHDDRNNCLFALALAQWDTKTLDERIYELVKEIIDNDKDLEVWKILGADEMMIKQRKSILNKFLTKISVPRENPKRRIRLKNDSEIIDLVEAVAPDNKKKFCVHEVDTNKQYLHTYGLMMWENGGGAELYYTEKGKSISAIWLDNSTLEISHDKDIIFNKKDNSAFFCGDGVTIVYKPV